MLQGRTMFFSLCVAMILNGKLFGQPDDTLPHVNNSKVDDGVRWTQALTWNEALAKAKSENKFIFLDCYATWCMPCRAMDKSVYSNSFVGKALNEKFISIKLQMDKTDYDNSLIKSWYNDAVRIQKNFSVTAFPTYLFFYPDGKPMHKEIGFKDPEQFVAVVTDALNPQKQYYSILKDYKPGKFDTSELKGLAQAFKYTGKELAWKMAEEYFTRIPKSEWGNKENLSFMTSFSESPGIRKIAGEYLSALSVSEFSKDGNRYLIINFKSDTKIKDIVLSYLESLSSSQLKNNLVLLPIFKKEVKAKEIADKYINSLTERELLNKQNLELITDFTLTTKDRGFNLFSKHSAEVDAIMGMKGYSKSVLLYVIDKEEITPYWDVAIKTGDAPWDKIEKTIKAKYSRKIAEEIVLNAKVVLYQYFAEKLNQHWDKYIKYNIEKIEKFGTDTTNRFQDATLINNFVFRGIFKHSDKKEEMVKGLRWMEGVIRRNPTDANHIDTYANLLYKAGEKEEAVRWQEKALEMAIREKQEYCIDPIKDNLSKMKNGKPTWIE